MDVLVTFRFALDGNEQRLRPRLAAVFLEGDCIRVMNAGHESERTTAQVKKASCVIVGLLVACAGTRGAEGEQALLHCARNARHRINDVEGESVGRELPQGSGDRRRLLQIWR